MLGISSNSVVTHPRDGPEEMAEDAKSFGTACQLNSVTFYAFVRTFILRKSTCLLVNRVSFQVSV